MHLIVGISNAKVNSKALKTDLSYNINASAEDESKMTHNYMVVAAFKSHLGRTQHSHRDWVTGGTIVLGCEIKQGLNESK